MWEPVLDHPLFMILPLIAPLFTKFYDSLSGFHCPPSFVLGPKAAAETFPQLDQKARGHPWPEPRPRAVAPARSPAPTRETRAWPKPRPQVKYCAVLHEGQHNDARTCTSIALTAALKGATISNHVEVLGSSRALRNDRLHPPPPPATTACSHRL